jgi:hypothetical protein
MYRILKISLAVFLLALVACEVKRPEHVLPPQRMEAFLYDYHLVQSMSGEYSSSSNKEKLFYDYVFRKHGVTREQFDTAMMWYNRYPKHLQRIYDKLEKRLDKEVMLLDNARGALDEGVSIEVAYLATDTAELWTSSKVRMLSPTTLCNRLGFSFKTPEDTTFLPGDSLVFSFSTHFFSSRRDSVSQSAYAAIVLDYADGTFSGTGLDVVSSGEYLLSVERNTGSRLKAMNGFIYYSDNDSTLGSKVVISDISVKRIRVAQDEEGGKK